MSSNEAPNSRELEYDDLPLTVKDFAHDPVRRINLPGFEVYAGADRTLGDAVCFEGVPLGRKESGEELNEPGIGDIYFVNSYEPGVGTKLVSFCIEEFERRGLQQVRLNIHNVKMLGIIEKLLTQGKVAAAKYWGHAGSPGLVEPSSDELLSRPSVDASEAGYFLRQFTSSQHGGYIENGGVYCLLSLTNH